MKEYKDFENLITHLKDNKNVFDINETYEIIDKRPYVSVINPYKKLFAQGEDFKKQHLYPIQIEVCEYEKLIHIDDIFCTKYHNLIGIFERKLKNEVIKQLCNIMVLNKDVHCIQYPTIFRSLIDQFPKDTTNYGFIPLDQEYDAFCTKTNNLTKEKRITLLEEIISIGNNTKVSNTSIVRHYQKTNHTVPFWILVHTFSFGDLTLIYGLLPTTNRKKVIKNMGVSRNDSYTETIKFEKQLQRIRLMRNIINHYETIFPFYLSDTINLNSTIKLLDNYNQASFIYHCPDLDISKYKCDYNKKIHDTLDLFVGKIK